MKSIISIGITTVLVTGLSIAAFTSIDKSKEIATQKEKIEEITEELQKSYSEIRRLRATTVILNEATSGLHQTQPESIKMVRRVVSYILDLKEPPEIKFKECWDRKLKTTNWGSDGPYGLLDECIDQIKNASSAALIREIDNATDAARSRCSEGANRYEMAKNCWADRNFRLLMSANQAIFAAITTPKWLDTQETSISE